MPTHAKLPRGAYEALLSLQLQQRLAADDADHRIVDLDEAEAAERLAGHLREVILQSLAGPPLREPAQPAARS
jgi:hypothetical protein